MITLICEAQDEAYARREILPAFPATETQLHTLGDQTLPEPEAGETIVTWLPDERVREVIDRASQRHWRIGLLPHPDMPHARIGFGIAPRLADAIDDVLKREDEVFVDVHTCDGQVVLRSVTIGDPFAAATVPGTRRRSHLFADLFRLMRALRRVTPHRFSITTAKEKSIDTAALGMVAVEHDRAMPLTRGALGAASAADGMLHLLIFAPHSAMRMIRFLVASMIAPREGSDRHLPEFIGHVRSESVRISSDTPFDVRVDGDLHRRSEILLAVRRTALMLIPGRELPIETAPAESKEIFRTSGLPTGDKLLALKGHPLPWLHRAAPEEFRDLFQMLRENARVSQSYVVLTILSTMLATFGLFADSAPVIIGAMILAPLMAPIVAMGMGVLRTTESDLLRRSSLSLLIGVLLAVGCTVVITMLTPLRTVNGEIAARINPTLLDMGIAVVSGIAGAYAHARTNIARSLAGVAIAVALVPPLAVCGIGIGWMDFTVFRGAGLLFLTNLAGIVLAAAGTFLVMGFSPFTFSRQGVGLASAAVLVVSLLLIPSFNQMVEEHRIIRLLDGHRVYDATIRDIRILHARPLQLSVQLVTADRAEDADLTRIHEEIERLLERSVTLEIRIAIAR